MTGLVQSVNWGLRNQSQKRKRSDGSRASSGKERQGKLQAVKRQNSWQLHTHNGHTWTALSATPKLPRSCTLRVVNNPSGAARVACASQQHCQRLAPLPGAFRVRVHDQSCFQLALSQHASTFTGPKLAICSARYLNLLEFRLLELRFQVGFLGFNASPSPSPRGRWTNKVIYEYQGMRPA